jgi:hypothetical protein
MTTETVLPNNILSELRSRSVISDSEVAIQAGDLFYAKNVLTNEKRMIDGNMVTSMKQNESLSESTSKTLLKG